MSSTFRKKRPAANKAAVSAASPSVGTASAADTVVTDPSDSTASPLPSSSSSSLLGLKGTKPWTGGITLTSTGLRELDTLVLVCGGQPLGTCILLEQDRYTSLGATLIKYWCSEALAQKQELLIPIDDIDNTDSTITNDFSCSPWGDDCFDDDDCDDDPVGGTRGCTTAGTCSFSEMTNDLAELYDLLHTLPRNLHKEKDRQKLQDKQQRQQQQSQDDGPVNVSESSSAVPTPILESLVEEEDEEEDEDGGVGRVERSQQQQQQNTDESNEAEEGLKIAWQYRKSVQEERMGVKKTTTTSSSTSPSSVFCHSYDLSFGIDALESDYYESSNKPTLVPLSCSCQSRQMGNSRARRRSHERMCGFAYYHQLVDRIQKLLQSPTGAGGGGTVVRLLLYHVDPSILSVALPLLLTHVRSQELPVVVMIASQVWKNRSNTASSLSSDGGNSSDTNATIVVRRCSDVVLEVHGFESRSTETYPPPPEFRTLHGTLQVHKVNTGTGATTHGVGGGHFADTTVTKRPAATLFGLKRDKRKLTIKLLHIPPEDYAQGGGSVGGGGVRSGAGRQNDSAPSSSSVTTRPTTKSTGCGGGGGGGNSVLDF